MATELVVQPVNIGPVLLTVAYQKVYEVPALAQSATLRGGNICNVDLTDPPYRPNHRVWLHRLQAGQVAGDLGPLNMLLNGQEFIDGIDVDGVGTLGPGVSVWARCDEDGTVNIFLDGAETYEVAV